MKWFLFGLKPAARSLTWMLRHPEPWEIIRGWQEDISKAELRHMTEVLTLINSIWGLTQSCYLISVHSSQACSRPLDMTGDFHAIASSLTALRTGEMAEFRKLGDRHCRSSCWWQRFPVSVYREAKMAAAPPPTLGWHWKRYEKDEAGNRRRGRGVGASWWTEAQLQLLIATGDLRPLDAMWNMFFFLFLSSDGANACAL